MNIANKSDISREVLVMYEAITTAYNESNAICNRANREKVYNYSILDKDF